MLANPFRKTPPYKGFQLFQRSSCNPGHTAEMEKKPLFRFFSDSFNIGKNRPYLGLASETPVKRDSEPVRLIPYLLKKFESL